MRVLKFTWHLRSPEQNYWLILKLQYASGTILPFLDNKAKRIVDGVFILSQGQKNKALVSKKSLHKGSLVSDTGHGNPSLLKDFFRVYDRKDFKITKMKLLKHYSNF